MIIPVWLNRCTVGLPVAHCSWKCLPLGGRDLESVTTLRLLPVGEILRPTTPPATRLFRAKFFRNIKCFKYLDEHKSLTIFNSRLKLWKLCGPLRFVDVTSHKKFPPIYSNLRASFAPKYADFLTKV
jgi:hypothetical protein